MGGTTRNRHQKRSKLFKRLNAGTDRRARQHQRLEARWKATGERRVAMQASQ